MIDLAALERDRTASRPWHNIRAPRPGESLVDLPDDTLLALLAWAEARSQGYIGEVMVCQVAQWRAELGGPSMFPWYGGGSLREVMLQNYRGTWAFSCFSPQDPQATLICDPTRYGLPAWEQACGAAFDVLQGRVPDLTDGATLYHRTDCHPTWDSPEKVIHTVKYRDHIFMREVT